MTVIPIKDGEIIKLIDKINDHFKKNITNRFLRKALLVMEIEQAIWDILDGLADKAVYGKLEGYKFHELYEVVIAAAKFIHHANKEIKPRLKAILSSGSSSVLSRSGPESDRDKVLKEMAISNFGSNLSIFADIINELYLKTVDLDKKMHPNAKCEYERNPELQKIGQYLVET
ncbi:MAG: hypothetical protein JXB88_20085 [Spirochaetales bacterium]|nr:hypothetical protein [Spirochaetales bacterium]